MAMVNVFVPTRPAGWPSSREGARHDRDLVDRIERLCRATTATATRTARRQAGRSRPARARRASRSCSVLAGRPLLGSDGVVLYD